MMAQEKPRGFDMYRDRFRRGGYGKLILGGIIAASIGAFFFLLAILIFTNSIRSAGIIYESESRIREERNKALLPLCITSLPGAGMLAMAAFAAYKVFDKRDWCVEVHPEGIVQMANGKETTIRWQDIASVRQSSVIARFYVIRNEAHKYTVELEDGETFVFDERLRDVTVLGNRIQRQVAKYQFPQALAALGRGETVHFGDLGISKQTLSYAGKIYYWGEIGKVDVSQGSVIVRRKNEGPFSTPVISVRVAKVPNVLIFLTLAKRCLQ
jgi:hypothetical protein